MMRLFVGLELPQEVRHQLSGVCSGLPNVRWVEADNFHMTLSFIGEVDENVAADIDDALAGISAPAFDVTFQDFGTFGHGSKLTSLWIGIANQPALRHLHQKVDTALMHAGLELQRRKFKPHVTLARLKGVSQERLGQFFIDYNDFEIKSVAIDHFTLFLSHLSQNGAHYEIMSRYDLTQGENQKLNNGLVA